MKKTTKLNVQGLARKDQGLMSGILPDPGNILVSIDLSAGEPTATTHFSRDQNYADATFNMVGKAPFYRDGLLKIDDIYLTTMSASPIGAAKMKEVFHTTFNTKTFAEQWIEDAEVIKKALKVERQLHKVLALGLGYGMGPKKLVKTAYEAGHNITMGQARAFHRSYWETFSGVRRFADRLAAKVKAEGQIINPFGYRLVPEPHKAFNYFIQSSISGVMDVFGAKLFTVAPYAEFVALIHDEFLVEVPTERLEEFRRHKELATDSLNADLKWSVKMRTGFVSGGSWFEAK